MLWVILCSVCWASRLDIVPDINHGQQASLKNLLPRQCFYQGPSAALNGTNLPKTTLTLRLNKFRVHDDFFAQCSVPGLAHMQGSQLSIMLHAITPCMWQGNDVFKYLNITIHMSIQCHRYTKEQNNNKTKNPTKTPHMHLRRMAQLLPTVGRRGPISGGGGYS